MFNPDKPIKKEEEDKLNRLNFIQNFSLAINNYNNPECLVIGLLGEWGSGKTSILNLSMNELNENFEIFRYNPWIFSEENDLILNFFIELLNMIKKIENDGENSTIIKTIKNLSSNIQIYSKKFLNNSTITGEVGIFPISINGTFSPNWEDKSQEESLEYLKEQINQDLDKLNKKILIIIDDIDRLSDNEVKQIFKLVKTVADFNNIIYILSFERKMILESLDKVQTYSPEKYLEKIVQIQIEVPKIEIYKLQEYFEDELLKTLKTNEIEVNDEEFFTISYTLKPFVSNMRDVNRFINHLMFHLPFLKQEVNLIDYLLILALQLFENEIYNDIKDNKRFFAGENSSFNRDERAIIEEKLKRILLKNKKLNKENLKSILATLFPKLYTGYGTDWLSTWRYDLKICHPDHFDKYFTLSIPETEIGQLELNSLFNYDEYENIKEKVFEFDKEGKSRELIEKMIYFTEKIPDKNVRNFIKLIIENGDFLNIPYKGFSINESQLTSIFISKLLKKLNSEDRLKFLKSIIHNLNNNIFTIISFLRMEELTIKKHENEPNSEDVIVLTMDEIEELNKIILEKIKFLTDDDKLLDCYHLDIILEYWALIENEKIVSEFLENCLKNKENIIKFIKGFEMKTSSHNLSEPFQRIHTGFNFKIMKKFINLEEFQNTILSMNNTDEYLNSFIEELKDYLKY